MMPIVTERLALREMTQDDFDALCDMLMDPEVMYAYNGAFTREEAQAWLDKQLARYRENGFGLWAVTLKETGEMIGQCGLSLQPWNGRTILEVGYLLRKAYWHKGYAAEAARACKRRAFDALGAEAVYSIIRESNAASRHVAERNGMTVVDRWTKHYRGVDMPHVLYEARRADEPKEP